MLLVYHFRDTLSAGYARVQRQYFPCTETIYYGLGEFDPKFGISKEEFLKHLNEAALKWNKAAGKELLAYKENSDFKVNLMYDKRQAVTDTLDDIGAGLNKSKAAYDALKSKYETNMKAYNASKSAFEKDWESFLKKNSDYNKKVEMVNSSGGATPEEYDALTAERGILNQEETRLKELESSLNKSVLTVNKLANELNTLARDLNLDVAKYNAIGGMQDAEFEEGRYYRDATGEGIDIYQFDNTTKLKRVLAHELGHALGIEHVEGESSIMYFLNTSNNLELTKEDKSALSLICNPKK